MAFGVDLAYGATSLPSANENPSQEAASNFQVKMNPWDLDLTLFEENGREGGRGRESFDMIVVASLIDRLPNLAGLSRTCEVFGVTTLVVPNISLLKEAEFKNISMTSDQWLDIRQVRPAEIESYLQMLRLDGYRILAVEQSSQSQPLQNYTFPRKTCLLMGNEKEGVPAELLQLVDDCVEIPQFGMIRSLNVHVSGSVVIWEARRQALSSVSSVAV